MQRKEKEANPLQVNPIKKPKTWDTAMTFAREPPDQHDPSVERHTHRERATAREANLRWDLRDIEKLLSDMPTLQDTNQEFEHIKELAKLAQKAQTTLRDLGANHRDDVTNAA